jgi:F-type H+-transporting ATPase subunit gamma
MKALAAANIGQYEQSVRGLDDYYRTVALGLSACFHKNKLEPLAVAPTNSADKQLTGAIVFGSDQGLVGAFNETITHFALSTLAGATEKLQLWSVGERVQSRLADAGLPSVEVFTVPTSVQAISPLVGQIQLASEANQNADDYTDFYIFYNRPTSGSGYEPTCQRLLPLDAKWQQSLTNMPWPSPCLPEILCHGTLTLRALIREYLFISLFRACAGSLASENASRLSAMERADKNIDELLDNFHGRFNQLRQTSIDEELFDVISGYEALLNKKPQH